jgi:hypothetical protein
MAALNAVPPPPPGFTLDAGPGVPPPPDGFTLDKPASSPGLGDEAKYIAGRTARLGVNAVTGLPLIAADLLNSLINAGTAGIDKVAGTHIPKLGMPSQTVTSLLDKFTPPSNTMVEKASDVGASALGGAGGFRLGANALARLLPQASEILTTLAQGPTLQATGAMAGSAATEGARKAGVDNPLALAGIGMVGSVLPGAGTSIATRVPAALAQPLMRRGREELVGEALNRLANTPAATAERLLRAQEIVPGSAPMVPAVARDPGLIRADSAVAGMDENGLIAARKSAQNAAQQRELQRITGDESTLAAAQAKRDRTFSQMAEPAFDNAAPLNIGQQWIDNPIVRTIQRIRESPAGKRQTVQEALDEVEGWVTQDGLNDPRALYAVRKDIDLLRTGKLSGAGKSGRERANMSTARHELDQVIGTIDDTIESSAPGYRDYMQMFAKRSVPLEQLKSLQSLREKAITAVPDPLTGDPAISQAKFSQLLRNNLVANPRYGTNPNATGNGPAANMLRGQGPGAATLRASVPTLEGKNESVLGQLSPNQIARLDRIAQDLDRNAAPQSSTMKTLGSDTFKNMSVAAVIGRVLGDTAGDLMRDTAAGKTLARPLNFLYRVPDREIQLLMLEAWQDPQLAGRLMQRASQHNIESIAQELKNRAARQAAAASVYGAAE